MHGAPHSRSRSTPTQAVYVIGRTKQCAKRSETQRMPIPELSRATVRRHEAISITQPVRLASSRHANLLVGKCEYMIARKPCWTASHHVGVRAARRIHRPEQGSALLRRDGESATRNRLFPVDLDGGTAPRRTVDGRHARHDDAHCGRSSLPRSSSPTRPDKPIHPNSSGVQEARGSRSSIQRRAQSLKSLPGLTALRHERMHPTRPDRDAWHVRNVGSHCRETAR